MFYHKNEQNMMSNLTSAHLSKLGGGKHHRIQFSGVFQLGLSWAFFGIELVLLTQMNIYGHFPKRYSKQKRINVTFECRWHVLHFLLVAGPQLNAVVLQGSARFAQGFDCSARQVPETGRADDFGKPGANRAQASRKLAQAHAQARPSRATACPCTTTCPFDSQHYSSLSYSFLSSYFSFLFFTFLRQFNLMYLCTSSSKAHRASDVDRVLRYKKNCLSFCLDETHASEMY